MQLWYSSASLQTVGGACRKVRRLSLGLEFVVMVSIFKCRPLEKTFAETQ